MEKETSYILGRIEGYMKFRGLNRRELAEKWEKTEAYVRRRLNGDVELSLPDILELVSILGMPKEEAADIFFSL